MTEGRTTAKREAAPVRTCAGCGRKGPQRELIRFAAIDGRLTPGRELPGRGVYTCQRLACFERAAARNAFNRVLRQTVIIDRELSSLYTGHLRTED
jgi:predicted RNA-binding protein YlxR (DUF448 family)